MRDNPNTRRFARACIIGGLLATFVFCWMITNARWDFGKVQHFGTVHDAQADALLNGRWNMPIEPLGIEAFKIDGKYYTYFGPFPALLRMPVMLFTNEFNGRFTITSMLLAFALLLVTASHLHWKVRSVLRPDRDVTTTEAVLAGLFTFIIGAGSIVAFLASDGRVYHEVELWGIAWVVAAIDAMVTFSIKPTRRSAVLAGVCATGAMMTRASMGIAAVVAVALIALGQFLRERGWGHGLARLGPGSDSAGRSHILVLVVGIVVACGLYAGVNYARFGSPTALPLDKQVFTELDAHRRATLADNGGSMFGAKFAPTGALQYTRPDALRFKAEFPWVTFPPTATVLGSVTYDTIDRSSSVPASMPGFTILAVIGLIPLFRPKRAQTTFDLARFWPPVIGGIFGTWGVLSIAFIANRYLADFFPVVLFLAILGVQRTYQWFDRAPETAARRTGAIALVSVFVIGAWFSWGLARVYQGPVPEGGPKRGTDISEYQP